MAMRPCCDSSVGTFEAIFSNSCDFCTTADRANQQSQLEQFGGSANGVPNCDPNAGFFDSLFSNSCNLQNPVGVVLGLPQVPSWVWFGVGGVIAFTFIKGMVKV